MNKVVEGALTVVAAMLVGLILIAITSLFGAMAWNHVMPDIFGMKEITYMQFFCLSFISNMLIRSYYASSNK